MDIKPVDDKDFDGYREEWLTKKTVRSLHYLYDHAIVRNENVSYQDLLDILGDPEYSDDSSAAWGAEDYGVTVLWDKSDSEKVINAWHAT